MRDHPPDVVLGPGEGTMLHFRSRNRTTLVKASEAETGGAYALEELSIAPASLGAPRHIHEEAEEAFYVLEGRLRIELSGRTVEGRPGSFVLIPRGAVHAFSNPSPEPARCLVILSPGWAGRYFEEWSELEQAAPAGGPDRAALAALRAKYRFTYLDEEQPW